MSLAEIGFYHLTRTGPDQALPALLGRTLKAGQRALVLCGSAAHVASLDNALWECREPDWLPHGTGSGGDAALQPIWIAEGSAREAPNGARYLFLLDGVGAPEGGEFDRVFDLFDGADAAAARLRWSACKAAGHALTYWQQTQKGWERK